MLTSSASRRRLGDGSGGRRRLDDDSGGRRRRQRQSGTAWAPLSVVGTSGGEWRLNHRDRNGEGVRKAKRGLLS